MALLKKKSFTNIEDLTNGLTDITHDIMIEVAEELLDELMEIIHRDVYANVGEPQWYNRTHDIEDKNAWSIKTYRWGNQYSQGNVAIGLEFNDSNLSYNGDLFQHGNPIEQLSPQEFLEILNGDRPQGNAFGFPQVDREPFWDDFLDYAQTEFPRRVYAKLQAFL